MNEEKDPVQNKQENKAEDAAAKDKKRKLIFWGIIAAIIILEIPIMLVTVKLTRPKTQEEELAAQHADSLRAATLEATAMGGTGPGKPVEAVVNIAETDGERFLKVSVVFEYDNARYPRLAAELERRMPKLQSMLIDVLAKMTLIELNESNARMHIRSEYMNKINKSLPVSIGQISNVLFLEFIIQ